MERLALLKQEPEHAELNALVAITYLERQQLEKAVLFSENAFKYDPENRTELIPGLHAQLGLAYGMLVEPALMEDAEQAETYFQKSVAHFRVVLDDYADSDVYEPAQYYLGVTYAIKEDYAQAIDVLQKLAQHATDAGMRQNAEAMLARVKELAADAK